MTLTGRQKLQAMILPIVLLAAAEIGLRLGDVKSDSVAPPSSVVNALLEALFDGSMLLATRDTLISALAGLFAGAAIGLLFGLLLGLVELANQLLEVTIETIRPIPSIALLPVALIAFGFGYRMEFMVVAYSCIWSLLIMTRAAIRGIEPRLLEVSRVLCLTPMQQIVKIVVPASLPRIFVAFRLAVAVSLIVSVTVEIALNPMGLGYGIMQSQQALRPDLMLAYLVWIGLLGFTLNGLLLAAQKHLFGPAAIVEDIR